ncbi:MAG: response regulator transcription factor [Bacillota bacterium]
MSGNSQDILVVEDDELIRRLQKSKLEKAGYQVSEAENGLEAWNLLQNNNYSLIIIDVFLPKLDGFQLLKNIQAQNNSAKTIMLSSKSQKKYIQKAYDIGVDLYMTKPFDSANLIEEVKSVLEN